MNGIQEARRTGFRAVIDGKPRQNYRALVMTGRVCHIRNVYRSRLALVAISFVVVSVRLLHSVSWSIPVSVMLVVH